MTSTREPILAVCARSFNGYSSHCMALLDQPRKKYVHCPDESQALVCHSRSSLAIWSRLLWINLSLEVVSWRLRLIYFIISLSFTIRLISDISRELTHTEIVSKAKPNRADPLRLALFSNQGIVAVVGIICIAR